MASSTKIVYETKPWLTGDTDVLGGTTSFANCGCPDARNTPPTRISAPSSPQGLSNYIQLGFSRSVSILLTTNTDVATGANRTFYSFLIGWIKTDDDTPIYIPVPMIAAEVTTGESYGFSGSSGASEETFFATQLVIDDTNMKPSGLGGTPTFSYNDPNAAGTLSAWGGSGDINSYSILKMENGWGLDGFQISWHLAATWDYNFGFLYSLA